MATRSLNKVMLIGNLTRDPELRYTPAGTAVCTFGLATNRTWTTQSGETKEETEFHRVVAWNKLAELCAQLMTKGRKVYVEGRLATHSWTGQDGSNKSTTEIVIEDMILLDSKRTGVTVTTEESHATEGNQIQPSTDTQEVASTISSVSVSPVTAKPTDDTSKVKKGAKKSSTKEAEITNEKNEKATEKVSEDITPDDIPF